MITGRDDNGDTFPADRPPGVRRNTLAGGDLFRLDLRWSKEWSLSQKKEKGLRVSFGVDAFNVLNQVNYRTFVGNLSSPFFGQPVVADFARRVQFHLGAEF